ncbi:GNAT family N-acetyltransferase [Acidithiobacillus ferridurans]|nr:GNAT family N-acetyltransferase [Acidithiobacillus ferridurans]MBU2731474.1 GNAT family N-acetyltransferase [Acidithiobacillus ferridurans]
MLLSSCRFRLCAWLKESITSPVANENWMAAYSPPPTIRAQRRQGSGRVHAEVVVGMLTLMIFRIPTGLRGLIEDVVVCESVRRKGIGALLIQSAINIAEAEGVRTLDLTSRPERHAANQLYEKLGFSKRDSNVYRMCLRI